MFFIAQRHFRTRRREKGYTASILSVSGIAVGVMTLTAVLAVMNGFQLDTIEDILEINSYHLRISASELQSNASPLDLSRRSGVRTVLPFIELQTIARGFFEEPQAVVLRGVPVDVLDLDPGIAERIEMVSGEFSLASHGSLVIGSQLARHLGVRVGDTVTFLDLGSGDAALRNPREVEFQVRGVFYSGFLEYDRSWGFISLQEAESMFGAGDDLTWGIKLNDRFNDIRMREQIAEYLELNTAQVLSWRDFNRAIFGALRVEKTVLMFLIGLIFLVVAVNIYQALRRSVVERSEEIAVLKALGAPPQAVQLVFVVEGLMIGVLGAFIGTALGLFISQNINGVFAAAELALGGLAVVVSLVGGGGASPVPFFSPEHFYIMEVPSHMLFSEVLGVFLAAVASAASAGYFASLRAAWIKPAEVLRDE
ncbi:MAG: ABC transporter permease [Spirochaetaceae bacterium]|nr:MAG: ABC transporter permease [Spirochaetaceae bacterium]